MNRPIALASLAALLLMAVPAPTASAAGDVAAIGCVQYMYIADYHWYYVCVDPKGGLCAVYFQERHGMTWSAKQCLVPLDDAAPSAVSPAAVCVPTNGGGLDYHSQVCVDAGDRRCLVLQEYSTDAGYVRKCYGTPF